MALDSDQEIAHAVAVAGAQCRHHGRKTMNVVDGEPVCETCEDYYGV